MPATRWNSRDIIARDTVARAYPKLPVTRGLELVHRPSRVSGRVVGFTAGQRVVLCDQDGTLHEFKPHPGVLLYQGKPVELTAGEWASAAGIALTASGSIDTGPVAARTARASRIWVEGIHDAELIEKVWGDDLRLEGIVVEPLHGADDLAASVDAFRPGPKRKLGVLLDHLVAGSKESRLAGMVDQPHVLVLGHPYVDIWQAVKPGTLGLRIWPEIPIGTPWKEGVIAALGRREEPAVFWRQLLRRVSSYRDLETPLIKSIEQLVDFVSVTR